MSLNTLEEIAEFIVSNGKGILAADESNPTCGKRFDSIGVESTETSRRDYREMLFRAPGMQDNIGGVILFDETIRQSAEDGTPLVDIIKNQGALPGIKVDKGLATIDSSPEETVTQGLDGLDERSKEYFSLGAKFTKWRAVLKYLIIFHLMSALRLICEHLQNTQKLFKTTTWFLWLSLRF